MTSKHYETNVRPYHLQSLNIITGKFLSKVIGGKDMPVSEKELWHIYNRGLQLSQEL
ncbi:MAG: type I-B CRISPR-associated protein Cas8b1/Cst1 [Persephonella sp.]|nr:type I-B CRISPR-associated protein Cas8b1/Cst1 [Persephonella sp.]